MKRKLLKLFPPVLIMILFLSCGPAGDKNQERIIIGLDRDIESVNPLFAMSEAESNICELMYLSLVGHGWDSEKGEITSYPMLAESFEWTADSLSVRVLLRDDVYWSDGTKFTADDVVYSFDIYSDPDVQSRFFGLFGNFFLNENLSVNLNKSFEILNPSELIVKFSAGTSPTLFDIDYPIIPKRVFEKIKRKDLALSDIGLASLATGAYKLKSWQKNQNITLELNSKSIDAKDSSPKEIVFKIIPDYNSRITQLKNGEIDITENIRAEDVSSLKAVENLTVSARKGREYDYLGLNNIDPDAYKSRDELRKNAFFGDPDVRKAICFAVDRKSILEQFLLNSGELMTGPVAPIFKSYIDTALVPYAFNPSKAAEMLRNAGWTDSDMDGVLEKKGLKFSFVLNVPSGNPLRVNTATVIQNNLKAVGIDAKIEMLEPAVLFDRMFGHEMNAWISGWGVPIPVDLKPYWYSDFNAAPANVSGYGNKEIDRIIDLLQKRNEPVIKSRLLKEFQKIIYDDEPVVFLFWLDNLIVYNKRIKNIIVTPLGSITHCSNWTIGN